MPEVTLEAIQALTLRMLDEQRETRREMREIRRETGDVRSLVLALSDKVTRLGRDLHEVKDDLWIMLKSEMMGSDANHEARVDARLAGFAERLDAIGHTP